MLKTLRLVAAFFQVEAKNTFVYRGMMLLWMIGWILSFLTMLFLWQAADVSGPIAGYDQKQLITYYFLGMFVWMVSGWYTFEVAAEKIHDGSIINLILKPVNFHWYRFGAELAWHTVNTFIYLLFFAMIIFFVKDLLYFDFAFGKMLAFIFSLVIAALATFESNMLLSMAAFWLTQYWGLGSLYWLLFSLFGGSMLPLAFFPEIVQPLIKVLPFRFMYSLPIEIYLNKINSLELLITFVIGIGWIVLFYLLYLWAWNKGLKVFTGVGL